LDAPSKAARPKVASAAPGSEPALARLPAESHQSQASSKIFGQGEEQSQFSGAKSEISDRQPNAQPSQLGNPSTFNSGSNNAANSNTGSVGISSSPSLVAPAPHLPGQQLHSASSLPLHGSQAGLTAATYASQHLLAPQSSKATLPSASSTSLAATHASLKPATEVDLNVSGPGAMEQFDFIPPPPPRLPLSPATSPPTSASPAVSAVSPPSYPLPPIPPAAVTKRSQIDDRLGPASLRATHSTPDLSPRRH
jgi:hypothetical protein